MIFHPVSEMNPCFPEPAGNIHKEALPFLGLQVAEVKECKMSIILIARMGSLCGRRGLGWISGKGSSARGCLGTEQAPQVMGTAPRLLELQECLGHALRDAQAGIFLCGPFWDWMILVGPFQVRIFYP